MPQKQAAVVSVREKVVKEASKGFPAIEKLLEESNFDFGPMEKRYHQLVGMEKSEKTAKGKASAKMASLAYERFFEIFEELVKMRARMAAKAGAQSKK